MIENEAGEGTSETVVFLDTSVILRYLTGEPPDVAAQASKLMHGAAKGQLRLLLIGVIFIETGYVLHKVLRLPRAETAALLRSLVSMPGLATEHPVITDRALTLFEQRSLSLADAYLAASALDHRPQALVASFDQDFDTVPGLRRITHIDII